MLDLVRGYYTTSMALYPDEKRTWQELHHALLLQQMLEHFLKGWPVLFVFHLDSKVAHSDTVWILHLLQITEHSFTHRQGFINVNGAQVYKLRLVYCPNINRLHRFPLLGCDISWIIRDFRCDIWHYLDYSSSSLLLMNVEMRVCLTTPPLLKICDLPKNHSGLSTLKRGIIS